ncbi:unnamed protein product [Porites lobata]|uniref:receptor protein-tyrosine kinase n=1 Tax=Porites lobata TaxID=104759 RepID=A0ABN8NHC8_9CNID|nr:unnamed protein product [Porites lobata]
MEFCWFAICTILAFIPWISAEEKLLYQTRNENNWGGWIANTNGKSSLNWNYVPVSNHYTLCSSFLQEPKNWLRSTVIDVHSIDRVSVSVRYTLNPFCSSHPNTFCTDNIRVFVWESDLKVTSDLVPDPLISNSSYREFATIRRQGSGQTISLALQLTKGYIVLGFLDQGGCKILSSVRITYNICPETTLHDSLVKLRETVAPSSVFESILVGGTCTVDSFHVQGSLNVTCESSGQWNVSQFEGKCVCNEDKENVKGTCTACSQGTYNDAKGLNCTAIPSHPRNVVTLFVNQSSATMNWQPPKITGDQVFYEVKCQRTCEIDGKDCTEEICGGDNNAGVVFMNKSYATTVTIPGTMGLLSPFVNYTCKIVAKNRVSEVAARKHKVEARSTTITFKTNGSVPGIPEVSVQQAEDGAIVLSWKLKCKNGIIEKYMVTYFDVHDTSDHESLTTPETEQWIQKLSVGKTYQFQVTAVNNFGQGPPGVKRFTIPNNLSGSSLSTKDKMVIIGAAGGGGLLLLILIIVIVVVFRFRRGSRRNVEKEYMRTIEQGTDLQAMDQRRYIDPGNYLDLMELLSTFTTEIERSKTKLDRLIGQGEFADVYKGTLQTPKGKEIVAIKVLRPGSNEKNQKDFLSEASIMGQFDHPNVIALKGVVTQSRPMMILTEFLESGSLDNFLKGRNGQIAAIQLLGMARGVANGMVYLSEMNFIHRDLAARNILVGENMSCKVSDFGLSRELADDKPDSEYETQGGKIPVRWTAPEALQHRKFSSASDVWSYGILLWEIMSFAERPYWDWNNYDVIGRVETGYRLPPPTGCPKVVHGLMLECWEADKNKRPKFAEIVRRLDELFRFPEVLNDDLLAVKATSEKPDVPQFRSVHEWLKFINMDKYSEVFKAANIKSLQKVIRLDDTKLKGMGITLIGHRNKMLKSIRSMKSQFVNRALDDDEAAI